MGFVSDIVLVELCRTLERGYRLPRAAIVAVLRALLGNSTVTLESPTAVREALTHFAAGAVGFPDCLIVAKALDAGGKKTLTFDRRMANFPDVELI